MSEILRILLSPFRAFWLWLLAIWCGLQMRRLGVSASWIRLIFSTMTNAGTRAKSDDPWQYAADDWEEFSPGTWVLALPNSVHVRIENGLEFTLQESPNKRYGSRVKQLVVHERQPEKREVIHCGARVVTDWKEVYREGQSFRSMEFVRVLRVMAGGA